MPPAYSSDADALVARYQRYALSKNIGNFSVLAKRNWQGYLASQKNSGTHYIKRILSLALANHCGVPEPEHVNGPAGDTIVGGMKSPRPHPHVPRIVSTHSIPDFWAANPLSHVLPGWPRYAVIVRDIRSCLASHYRKSGEDYGVSFGEFLRAAPGRNGYMCDLWWLVRFQNQWARFHAAKPSRTLILRYEDLLADPTDSAGRVLSHFGIDVAPDILASAAERSDRQSMRAQSASADRLGNIQETPTSAAEYFSEADEAFLKAVLAQTLSADFGYDYGLCR